VRIPAPSAEPSNPGQKEAPAEAAWEQNDNQNRLPFRVQAVF